MGTEPVFFASPSAFRAWLEKHHDDTSELLVGFYKRSSGRPSITWPESVEQALCFGWIDGVRRSIDDTSYTIRFTPRKARNNWSAVNIKKASELIESGLMRPAGLEAFKKRTEARSGIYSYEQRHLAKLDEDYEARFRANEKAWAFFQSKPPSYRKAVTWWVVSAKKEETRLRRLAKLIEESERENTIGQLTPRPKKK
ncbi:MAG: YdeI/OmpD-associated family protein [Actinomycetota bacterium]